MLSTRHSSSSSTSANNACKRTSTGQQGRKILVKANYFEISCNPNSQAFVYQLVAENGFLSALKPFQKIIVWTCLSEQMRKHLPEVDSLLFDYRSNCFISPNLLPDNIVREYHIIDTFSPDRQPVSIRIVSAINANNLMDTIKEYFAGKSKPTATLNRQCLDFLDLILRQSMKQEMFSIGKSLYSRDNCKSLGYGAECWLGQFQKVISTKTKMYINVDIAAGTFYESCDLIQLCRLFTRANPAHRLSEYERFKLEYHVLNLKFSINHRGSMRKRFKISGITKLSASEIMFHPNRLSPLKISVAQYFAQNYYSLKYPNMPCVVVKKNNNQTLFFPLEVCDIVPGQRYVGKLSETQTSTMIEMTCKTPEYRQQEIHTRLNNLQAVSQPLLDQYNVTLHQNMAIVPARVLSPPTLLFGPKSEENQIAPSEGSWNFKSKKVALPATLTAWSVVFIGAHQENTRSKLSHFISELVNIAEELGLNVTNKSPDISFVQPNFSSLREGLENSWRAAGQRANRQPQLIFCILPNNGSILYGNIKKICDTHLGVVSQCLQASQLFHPRRQYYVNLVLKINTKLGGVNSFLPSNQLEYLTKEPAMIFGVDIVRPITNESARKTIASIVGSLDSNAVKYASTCRIQNPKLETIPDALTMFGELICEFIQQNKTKPSRILVYRNAKLKDNIDDICKREHAALVEACQIIEIGYKPKITFVLVDNNHHTRFFPIKPADMDKNGNLLPGTVVEQGITHPLIFEFFLCSHAGLQGTSKPTYYRVISDDYGFTPDELQRLTYNLCFTYSRSTRSVSVTPPSYYAHLAALRARFYFSKNNGNEGSAVIPPLRQNLLNTMYFL